MNSFVELVDNFKLFDDWEDRYRYLIDLGGKLSPMADELLSEENIVKGCTSKVWMVIENDKDCFKIQATSDAQIVKGLIFLILLAYEGKGAEEILAYNIEEKFEELGLHQYLSPNRRNGFFAMADKIKSVATAAIAAQS